MMKHFANCTYYVNLHHQTLKGVITRESISKHRLSFFPPAVRERMNKNNTKNLYLGLLVDEEGKRRFLYTGQRKTKTILEPCDNELVSREVKFFLIFFVSNIVMFYLPSDKHF